MGLIFLTKQQIFKINRKWAKFKENKKYYTIYKRQILFVEGVFIDLVDFLPPNPSMYQEDFLLDTEYTKIYKERGVYTYERMV